MSRKKSPPQIDINKIAADHTLHVLNEAAAGCSRYVDRMRKRHELLCILIVAGLVKKNVYEMEYEVKYGGVTVEIPKSKLGKLREVVGPIKDNDFRELVNAKRRTIRVGLTLEDWPWDSVGVQVNYIRPYTKEEEETKGCKIQKVEVSPAQPAQPAKEAQYDYRLVCPTQS